MAYVSSSEFKNDIIKILINYCNKYIVFKPRHYVLAQYYLNKIGDIKCNEKLLNTRLLRSVFELYKNLIESSSENLADQIGLSLALELNINETEFARYREARIWTQRYIHGLGPFESQIYLDDGNTIVKEIITDPLYAAYIRLNNRVKLDKVEIQHQPEVSRYFRKNG